MCREAELQAVPLLLERLEPLGLGATGSAPVSRQKQTSLTCSVTLGMGHLPWANKQESVLWTQERSPKLCVGSEAPMSCPQGNTATQPHCPDIQTPDVPCHRVLPPALPTCACT